MNWNRCFCGIVGVLLSSVTTMGQPSAAPACATKPGSDGSIIVTRYRPADQVLDMIRVGADDSVTLIGQVGCPAVSSMSVVDSDGDGAEEFAISMQDTSAIVLLTVLPGGLAGGQIIETDEPVAALLSVGSVLGGSGTLVGVGLSGTAFVIETAQNAPPTGGPVNSGSACDTKYEQCGPDCSCTPIGPGIQACIEATRCRTSNCHWAACINYESGDSGGIATVGAHLACASVYWAEVVGCLPSELLPD